MTESGGNGRPLKSTGVRFDPEIYEELRKASEGFHLSINVLVNYAVKDFLARMIDPKDVVLTRG